MVSDFDFEKFVGRFLVISLMTVGMVLSSVSWSDSSAELRRSSAEQSVVAKNIIKPNQWLDKMEESARTLSYKGTLVYLQGQRMETVQIYHKKEGSLQRERLVHLTGEAREIIRHGDKVVCLHPRKGLVKLDGSTPTGPFSRKFAEKFRTKDQPYDVTYKGDSRIAGRAVVTLEVSPRDQYRYGFQLALDQETGLLLQLLMVDEEQNVLERFSYTQISIGGEVSNAQLSPRNDIANANWVNFDFVQSREKEGALSDTASAELKTNSSNANRHMGSLKGSKLSWQASWVPSGFVMATMDNTSSLGRVLALEGQKLDSSGAGLSTQLPLGMLQGSGPQTIMYTDGLTTFSIFIADEIDMGDSQIQNGATAASTRVKNDSSGLFSVTVVGEIPSATAVKIANSVSRLP